MSINSTPNKFYAKLTPFYHIIYQDWDKSIQKQALNFQVWEFHDRIYDLSMYFIEDKGGDECVTHVMRTKYYAIGTSKLINLMQEAGFRDVKRIDSKFFQPVLLGAK
jgi:hypothetical protein